MKKVSDDAKMIGVPMPSLTAFEETFAKASATKLCGACLKHIADKDGDCTSIDQTTREFFINETTFYTTSCKIPQDEYTRALPSPLDVHVQQTIDMTSEKPQNKPRKLGDLKKGKASK